jgi:UDPglucose--hexose-1-phosphate uridylyltransferase
MNSVPQPSCGGFVRPGRVLQALPSFELLASPQRDITPESAAERLRGASELHYLDR